MRLTALLLSSLWISSPLFAQEPTLEDLESLGEGVEAEAAATQPAAEAPSQAIDIHKPASDRVMTEAIDIRSHIKKISEPNLFSGAAPNPGTLRNLATGEAPEEYNVSEGDTLFDICDQLIDEPKYWPKLWAFNPNITNPHFVYPGMRLRFYAGDNESPPFLQVITEDDILPVAKGKVVESELVREDINGMLMRSEIPENMKIVGPDDLRGVGIDGLVFEVGGQFSLASKSVLIPAFVVDEEFETLGRVVGGSAGSFLLDKGQQTIVKQVDGLKVGSTYSVVRRGEDVRNPANNKIGIRYEFIAQLKLDIEDKSDADIFKGSVVFNRLGIQPGDILVSYRSVKREVPRDVRSEGKGLQQGVVGFTEPNSSIGGRGDFVFIDQTDGKLKEKESYNIIQNVKVASSTFMHKVLPDTDSKVAHVYIIDTSGAAAIGYLTHDSFEVRLGDRVSP